MMTTLTKYMKKTTAIAMAAMVLSLPLASVASAHERHDAPPPRHSDRSTATTSMIVMTDMTAMTSIIRTTIT